MHFKGKQKLVKRKAELLKEERKRWVETEMVVQNKWEISLTGNCKEMKYMVACTNA